MRIATWRLSELTVGFPSVGDTHCRHERGMVHDGRQYAFMICLVFKGPSWRQQASYITFP